MPVQLQGDSGRFFFGFREMERLTEGLLVQGASDCEFRFVNHAKHLSRLVADKSQKLLAFQKSLTSANGKTMAFVGDLLHSLVALGHFDLSSKFEGVLSGFLLHSCGRGFKLTVTNLFIVAASFEVFELEVLRFLFKVAVAVDGEDPHRVPSGHSHADFLLEMFTVFLRFRDKGTVATHRSTDPFVNHFTDFLAAQPAPATSQGLERMVGFLSDSFLDVVLRMDRPRFLHYFMPLLCSLKSEVTIQGRPGNFRELFFQRLFQSLLSNHNPSVVKERALGFIHAYVLAVHADSAFLYEVVYYLQQLLFLLTKRIVKKARLFCPEDAPAESSEVADQWLRAAFNTPLFARLVCCLTAILSDNVELISTHAKIDIINFFEPYFARFFEYLRTPLHHSPAALEVFLQLNRFLRISRLFDLEGATHEAPAPSSPLRKRPMLSSTYCSMSAASFSVASENDVHDRHKPGRGVWSTAPPELLFDGQDLPFFGLFLARHGRSTLRKRYCRKDSGSESLALSRRSSLSAEHSPLPFPCKRVKEEHI